MNTFSPLLLSLIALASAMMTQCSPYSPYYGTPASTYGGGTQYLAGYGPTHIQQHGTRAPQPRGYWDGDGISGASKIRIVRHEQKAYFYKGETLVGVAPISSGDLDHQTPAGRYRVTQKSIDHKSSLYGVIKNKATGEVVNNDADIRRHKPKSGEFFEHAPMPYFMRFNHGIGMHTGYLPGYAASHGCVRLPDHMARKFFENSKLGTPVIVE